MPVLYDRFVTVLHPLLAIGLLFGMVLLTEPRPAVAQTEVMRSPAEIGRCLCLAPILERRRAESDLARARFERLQAELRSEEEALDYERTRIDPDNQAEVDSFRRRLAEAQETRTRLENDLFPAAERATLRHAQAYGEYTPMCTRQFIDADILARVRRDLICPAD